MLSMIQTLSDGRRQTNSSPRHRRSTPTARPIRIRVCSGMPFGLSGVSSSRSVLTSRSKASGSSWFGCSSSFVAVSGIGDRSLDVKVLAESKSASPPQLVAQNVKVVSVAGLNQIERRVALSNHNSILNLQREIQPAHRASKPRLPDLSLNATSMTASSGTTMGRFESVKGQIGVINYRIHRRKNTGPPAERLYAVEPVGVETIKPSARNELTN